MTTISADTSIMDILDGGASAKFFGLLEESNDINQEQLDRQKNVEDEMASMSDAVMEYQEGIKKSFNQTATRLKDSITNPINKMRNESITAYTNFTESIHEMKDGVSQNLLAVKDGFSTKVDSLKTGFTDAVAMTNDVLDVMSVKMEAFSNLPTEQQIMLAGKVVADGVMNTISAIPDAINNGMDKLNKGISAVGGFVKSSSGYLKGLFTKSEESEDVGGTSGISGTDTKPKDDTGTGGIGSLIGKIVPKGLIKNLGKVGKLAGKLALPLVAIMGIFDFIGGVQDAANIVGKAEDKLSTLEKFGAGIASVISGLTLGFIDAKTIFSEGKQVIDSISSFVTDMFKKLPTGIQDGLKGIFNNLFDSKTGIFSSIGRIFSDTIDSIADGNYGEALLNILTAPLQYLFSSDGVLVKSFDSIASILPNSFKESITGFVDTLIGWFDKIKNFASDLIPDSIKNFFGDVAESDTGKAIGKGLSATKSFFGFGDDTKDSKITERKSINDVAGVATVDKKIKQKTDSSSAIVVRTNNASPESRIGETNGRAKAITKRKQISENEIITTRKSIKDSDTATKKSKLVMNRKQDIAPVIIQQPAPAQRTQGSGRQINTSTTIGDTELAVMNSNMMD